MRNIRRGACLGLAAFLLSAAPAFAQQSPPEQRRAFFGEMHVHTTFSFDAWTFGAKIDPDIAYKFAKGQTVTVGGVPTKRTVRWSLASQVI